MRDELADAAGVQVQGGPDPETWARLARHPDRYDKKGNLVDEGMPKPTLPNLATILTMDPRWRGRIRYNEFAQVIELDGVAIQDQDEIAAVIWMADNYGLNAATNRLSEAAIHAAHQCPYHPVRDYLNRLQWDGEERIGTWLSDYMGAEALPVVSEIGKRFLMSCVARVMEPGCKVDTVTILQGPQGARKSTGLQALCGPEWFGDTALDLRNKDALAMLRGRWIYEWSELDSLRRRDSSTVKAFIASQVDRYRPAYGRNILERPRQCVFVGTTNEAEFLTDASGERRFWPVQVRTVDLEGIKRDRDQLWAEALTWYREERRWWLSEEMAGQLEVLQEHYKQSDTWAEALRAWVAMPTQARGFELREAMEDGLGLETRDQHTSNLKRLVNVLTILGCTKSKRRESDGGRRWVWMPPE